MYSDNKSSILSQFSTQNSKQAWNNEYLFGFYAVEYSEINQSKIFDLKVSSRERQMTLWLCHCSENKHPLSECSGLSAYNQLITQPHPERHQVKAQGIPASQWKAWLNSWLLNKAWSSHGCDGHLGCKAIDERCSSSLSLLL